MLKLSIVIVNYKTPKLVIDCLESLMHDLMGEGIGVVVVDNDSGDSSVEDISNWVADNNLNNKIQVLPSGKNGGFSAGNNFGIKASKAENYLLLNSDTIVREGAIQALMNTLSQHQEVGILGPRLEWLDGIGQNSCFRFISPTSEMISSAQTGLVTQLFSGSNVPLEVSDKRERPDWISFACVLVRQEVFEKVGLLDEEFFMYFEDTEFCHRVRQAGWEIMYEPVARVVHFHGGSSRLEQKSKENKRLPRFYYESRSRYFYLIYGHLGLFLANMLWTLGRCISLPRQLLGRKDKAICEKQWRDIWIHCLKPLTSHSFK